MQELMQLQHDNADRYIHTKSNYPIRSINLFPINYSIRAIATQCMPHFRCVDFQTIYNTCRVCIRIFEQFNRQKYIKKLRKYLD